LACAAIAAGVIALPATAAVVAKTEGATELTPTTVVLHATIETGGAEVLAGFQIGPASNPESGEGPGGQVIPAGETKPVHISHKVTGLKPNADYFYRAGVMGGGGALGEWVFLHTPKPKGLSVNSTTKQWEALSYPASIFSETSLLKVKFKEAEAKCTSNGYTGSLAAASSTLTLSPALKGCVFFGESATIKPNSCGFTLSPETASTGSVGISCSTAGDGIEIAAAGCTVKFPQQSAVSSAFSYTSGSGEGSKVSVQGGRTLTYSTNGGGLCFLAGGTAQFTFEGLLKQG
jgi:hypothetical protein